MIELVLSGGQDGADLGGWKAARAAGISCSGWMTKGFVTESGPRPEYAGLYGAKEMPTAAYPPRTRANVRDADATIVFMSWASATPGSALTEDECERQRKPIRGVLLNVVCGVRASGATHTPQDIVDWIIVCGFRSLNVAGVRESKAPGVGAFVERYMAEVFRLLATRPEG